MDTNPENARQQAWSSYWAAGALHSCVGSFTGNYAGAMAGFWQSRFRSLGPRGRVLDLATGNGALPLLLWEQMREGDEVRVDAVDLAQVAPAWHRPSSHPGISFHSGVAMERLPFAEGTFDLVVSQFGLEYADWPEALHECARVGKPQGAFAFVMHHADSVLVAMGKEELENQKLLLHDDGLLAAACGVIPWIAQAQDGVDLRGNADAARCKEHYNLAMARIGASIEASPVPDLLVEARAYVHGLLAQVHVAGTAPQLSKLVDYRDALQSAALRTAELIEHALDRDRAHGLLDFFRTARPSHTSSCEPISQEQGILGWGFVIAPAPDLAGA